MARLGVVAKVSSTLEHLRLADGRLRERDFVGAMPHVLDAWRRERALALSELAVQLDERMPAPKIAGVMRGPAYEARWQAKLERGGVTQVGFFARMIDRVERLEALLPYAPDPRISRAVGALLADLRPAHALGFGDLERATHALWLRAAEVVEKLDDPSLLALRDAPHPWDVAQGVGGLSMRLDLALSALERHFPNGPPQLDAVTGALVDELTALLRQPARERRHADEEALVHTIYAAPRERGPRWVYADWLLEQGDEHGELIQLQLTDALDDDAKARLAELEREAAKRWVGPLAPVLTAPVFRRGFVAEATVGWRHQGNVARLGSHPAWATLERLHWGAAGIHMRQYLDACVTLSLEELTGVDDEGAVMLAAAPVDWTLRRLSLLGHAAEVGRKLSETTRLPRLVELELLAEQSASWLWKAGFRTQLERLAVAVRGRRDLWQVQTEASRLPRLESLSVELSEVAFDLSRGPEHRFTHAVVRDRSGSAERFIELLEMAPEYAFTHLDYALAFSPNGQSMTDAQLARFDDAAARQRGLDDVVVQRGDIPP